MKTLQTLTLAFLALLTVLVFAGRAEGQSTRPTFYVGEVWSEVNETLKNKRFFSPFASRDTYNKASRDGACNTVTALNSQTFIGGSNV